MRSKCWSRICRRSPESKGGWSGTRAAAGRRFSRVDGFDGLVAELRRGLRPFLSPDACPAPRAALWHEGARDPGRRDDSLGGALGRDFGATLTEAEVDYLIRREWARTADDIVWRRTKLGLKLNPGEIDGLETALAQKLAVPLPA